MKNKTKLSKYVLFSCLFMFFSTSAISQEESSYLGSLFNEIGDLISGRYWSDAVEKNLRDYSELVKKYYDLKKDSVRTKSEIIRCSQDLNTASEENGRLRIEIQNINNINIQNTEKINHLNEKISSLNTELLSIRTELTSTRLMLTACEDKLAQCDSTLNDWMKKYRLLEDTLKDTRDTLKSVRIECLKESFEIIGDYDYGKKEASTKLSSNETTKTINPAPNKIKHLKINFNVCDPMYTGRLEYKIETDGRIILQNEEAEITSGQCREVISKSNKHGKDWFQRNKEYQIIITQYPKGIKIDALKLLFENNGKFKF